MPAAPARGDEVPAGRKTVRLLTVGNSFSGNATKYLADLAEADGNVLVMRSCSVGGASMELHWGKVVAHQKDPADPKGLYASKKGLKQELAAEKWDFVTIQQASIKSHDLATYRPFARQLHDYIKANAPGADVLVHQTWAYRVDDPRFTNPKPKPGEPISQAAMYEMLTKAYTTIAAELGVRRIPVGDAFYLADTNATWGFKPDTMFDPKAAREPALPDQTHSLHTGWQWAKPKAGGGAAKLTMDGHHANAAGQYLGACVWYEVLFGRSVVENTFVPKGLDPAYAEFLRETAHRAVTAAASATAPAE
jgi:hypothetical protein